MTETGWPLIPREVFPAPIPAAKIPPARTKIGPRLPAPPGDAGRQLSIFGAETTEPSPADLAGLLAGPGRLGRMGGTARVTVPVDAAWRVHVLVAELVRRGLVVNWHPTEEVRDDVPRIVPELSDSSENPVKGGTSVPRPSVPATFDPDADPTPDLPSDVDFVPGRDTDADADPDADGPVTGRPRSSPRPSADRQRPARSREAPQAVVPADESGNSLPDSPGIAPADEPPADPAAEAEEGLELPEPPPKPRFEVVTAYSSRLNGLARAWPDAAAQLFLSGPRLRLWVAAAGEPVPGGYALGLGPVKDSPDELPAIDAALVRAGLAGRVSDDGRHYVIAGRRRLKRLAELVGERPAAAPPELWPGGAAA